MECGGPVGNGSDIDVTGWSENERGVWFTFGTDVVVKFINRHNLDHICCAHKVVEEGYEFFAKRQLANLFSAPNLYGEFDNAGAICEWMKPSCALSKYSNLLKNKQSTEV